MRNLAASPLRRNQEAAFPGGAGRPFFPNCGMMIMVGIKQKNGRATNHFLRIAWLKLASFQNQERIKPSLSASYSLYSPWRVSEFNPLPPRAKRSRVNPQNRLVSVSVTVFPCARFSAMNS